MEFEELRREKAHLQEEQAQLQQALEHQAATTEQQIRSMAAMSEESATQLRAEHEAAMTQLQAEHQEALETADKEYLKGEASYLCCTLEKAVNFGTLRGSTSRLGAVRTGKLSGWLATRVYDYQFWEGHK